MVLRDEVGRKHVEGAPSREVEPSGRRGDTVEIASFRIREMILSGKLALGQRLIARELGEALGCSRNVLREAFSRLATEGQLELIPNQGARVRRLSRRDLQEAFAVRTPLETLAARLAAENIAAAGHREQLERLLKETEPSGLTGQQEFLVHNQAVHEAIVDQGRNALLKKVLEHIQLPFIMLQVNRALGREQIANSLLDHREIIHYIINGDKLGAEQSMGNHLIRSSGWMLALEDEYFSHNPL